MYGNRDHLDAWQATGDREVEDIRVVGHRWSERGHDLKLFLARNHVPYRWFDIERDAVERAAVRRAEAEHGAGAAQVTSYIRAKAEALGWSATVGVIERAFHGGASRGPRIQIRSEHGSTNYRVGELGPIVLMPSAAAARQFTKVKFRAIELARSEGSVAIRLAQREHGETEGRAWGKWTAIPTEDGAYVTYEPHTGNPAFADRAGKRGSWSYMLAALDTFAVGAPM